MDADEDQRRPDRRSRQLVGADGLSLEADDGESERMGPMDDAAGAGQRGVEALRRGWCEYQSAKEDSEVLIASRPRSKAMTAEQEKWVHDLPTHPVLTQSSTGGPSPARKIRESVSNPLTNPSLGELSHHRGSLRIKN